MAIKTSDLKFESTPMKTSDLEFAKKTSDLEFAEESSADNKTIKNIAQSVIESHPYLKTLQNAYRIGKSFANQPTIQDKWKQTEAIKNPIERMKAIREQEGIESNILEDPIVNAITFGGAAALKGAAATNIVRETLSGLTMGGSDIAGLAGKAAGKGISVGIKKVIKDITQKDIAINLEKPIEELTQIASKFKKDYSTTLKAYGGFTEKEIPEIAKIDLNYKNIAKDITIKGKIDGLPKDQIKKQIQDAWNTIPTKESKTIQGIKAYFAEGKYPFKGKLAKALEEEPINFLKKEPWYPFKGKLSKHLIGQPFPSKTESTKQILKTARPNSLLEITPGEINELTGAEIKTLGNTVTSNAVEEIAPYINRLAERLGQEDTARLIQQNMANIEKRGESVLLKELSNAIYRKEKIGKYGSVTKIVNNQKNINGMPSMPIYEAEMNLLRSLPIKTKKTGAYSTPIRTFDEYPEVKDMLYNAAREAEHTRNLEYIDILSSKKSDILKLNKTERERIGIYAMSLQKDGMETMINMGKKIPELTGKEKTIYDYMRSQYEQLYPRLNEVRVLAGQKPFDKVENYFTFFRQLDKAKDAGFDLAQASKESILDFIQKNTTSFAFAKQRVKSKLPLELDSVNVFKKYLHSALENIHLSPVITKTNKLRRTLYTGKILKDGTKKTFKLNEANPYFDDFLREWNNDLAGMKRVTRIAGIDFEKLDKFANWTNKNLIYSKLAYNIRSALMQPFALRNTFTALGPIDTMKGLYRNCIPAWRKLAMKTSNVLDTRLFEHGIEQQIGKVRKIQEKTGDIGISGLKYLDMETARSTWLGAFNKATKEKSSFKDAINYADDIVTETQGSASKIDRIPLARTPAGRMFSLFQTFATYDYQFLKKDVLGIGTNMSKSEVAKKALRWLVATEGLNIIAEEGLGIDSPFPNPYKVIKESAEAGDSKAMTVYKTLTDTLTVHPLFGSAKYGRTVGGAATNLVEGLMETSKTRKDFDWMDIGLDVGGILGVPGMGQIAKFYKIKELGGSNWDALAGKYPDKKKKTFKTGKIEKIKGI